MNGTGLWKTVQHQETGRPYYYNSESNETAWTKPDELLTPAQIASGWGETTHTDGKTYWFRKDDRNQTTWSAPAEWTSAPPERSQMVASSIPAHTPRDQPVSRDHRPRDDWGRDGRDRYPRNDTGGYTGPTAFTPQGVEYANFEDAQNAFHKLLRRVGVQSDWTWEQGIRAAIQDPSFRAIKEPVDRRTSFEKFQGDMKAQQKEQEKEKLQKVRNDFRAMLKRHTEIKHYTRWKTALPMIEAESEFRAAKDEDEKRSLFREYIAQIRQDYEEKRIQDHEAAMRELSGLLREVKVTPESEWEETYKRLQSNDTFVHDDKFQTVSKLEVLETFKAQIRGLWDDVNTIKQREKSVQFRKQRKAREDYTEMLKDLSHRDKITPESTWSQTLPLIEDDSSYHAMFDLVRSGDEKLDGSSPLDLFFDFIQDLQEDMEAMKHDIGKLLKVMRFKFTTKTSADEMVDAIKDDRRFAPIRKSRLEAVHKLLHGDALEDEEHMAYEEKRRQRRHIDALRSCIKRLEPPVTLDDTWEEVRPRLERFEEYDLLRTDEDRKAAFEKHLSRLQEDIERERAHRRDRERVREDRHPRRDRRRSRSPQREADPYEADRRRAQEQRERSHRHGSSTLGLSPPPRERRIRDSRDRDDFDARDRRDSRGGYERERKTRAVERERAYISRADPYSKATELDYGDSSDPASRPASSHGKRKVSDAESFTSPKRLRLTRPESVEATEKKNDKKQSEEKKAEEPPTEEAPALQSGSEEGEIEEV